MTKTYSVILCCSCFGMEKRAAEAFSITHPTSVLPEIVRGRDRIYKLAEQYKSPHLKAISKLSGKYAYYLRISESGEILEEMDLLTGKRIR